MTVDEPPPPQRGRSAEERGSDASAPEREAAAAPDDGQARRGRRQSPASCSRRPTATRSSIKQFLQFCLVLIYPAWLFFVLVGWVIYGFFWLLFLPLRLVMKRKDPEAYAASQRK